MPPDDSLELFAEPAPGIAPGAPLADRMRPRDLDQVAGQDDLVGPAGPLRALSEAGELPSLILWGPPGCGKTTLARLLATGPGQRCGVLSAVTAGVTEIRETVNRAPERRRASHGARDRRSIG
jgi:putative ATPase